MYKPNELKATLVRLGITRQQLASRLNMTRQALYPKLNGKIQWKQEEIYIIKDFLNLDLELFMTIFFAPLSTDR